MGVAHESGNLFNFPDIIVFVLMIFERRLYPLRKPMSGVIREKQVFLKNYLFLPVILSQIP
jgi:hypothetical protein